MGRAGKEVLVAPFGKYSTIWLGGAEKILEKIQLG
jgi:hypothetical protein